MGQPPNTPDRQGALLSMPQQRLSLDSIQNIKVYLPEEIKV
jgi:hypothetical protein